MGCEQVLLLNEEFIRPKTSVLPRRLSPVLAGDPEADWPASGRLAPETGLGDHGLLRPKLPAGSAAKFSLHEENVFPATNVSLILHILCLGLNKQANRKINHMKDQK